MALRVVYVIDEVKTRKMFFFVVYKQYIYYLCGIYGKDETDIRDEKVASGQKLFSHLPVWLHLFRAPIVRNGAEP